MSIYCELFHGHLFLNVIWQVLLLFRQQSMYLRHRVYTIINKTKNYFLFEKHFLPQFNLLLNQCNLVLLHHLHQMLEYKVDKSLPF